eukprot:TRINITY_DN5936_c0_g1_i3.p2 TRINITY_DN5936_c0_g1~~TRINITY_DN5936_c0_g1_i3.p2  ORF type:complete len:179 (+),score=32.86 TRINITY_DN5936_c0_g1_i3:63-599(+)
MCIRDRSTWGYLWVYYDQITDPQNFGALLRSAFFFGVDGILVDEDKRCPLTPAVSKASAGAMELLEVYCAERVDKLFKECKNSGWRIISASVTPIDGKNITPMTDIKIQPNENIILVMGSEYEGIRKHILNTSNDLVYIRPGISEEDYKFPFTLVDSLNVSVSCGVLLSHIKNKLHGG